MEKSGLNWDITPIVYNTFRSNVFEDFPIFCKGLCHLLFFDENYIAHGEDILSVITRTGVAGAYVGYLDRPFFENERYSEGKQLHTYFVSSNMPSEIVDEMFSIEPKNSHQSAIAVYTESAFAISEPQKWAIWFSKRWELAVAAFNSQDDADKFREQNSHIYFVVTEELLDMFSQAKNDETRRIIEEYSTMNAYQV